MENESPVKQWSHLHKILYRLRNRRPFIDDTFLLLSAGLWNFHLRTA
ncbi:hypothetical protein [Symbiopectobacterium purcellii]